MLTWEKWVLLLFQLDSHPLGRLFAPTLFRIGIEDGARSIEMKCFRSPKKACIAGYCKFDNLPSKAKVSKHESEV